MSSPANAGYAGDVGVADAMKALSEDPNAVLVDVRSQPEWTFVGLPDLNGYEVGRELRQRLGPSLRLVALTGYGQPQDRARTEEAGFDAHVVKPVDPAKLTTLLQRLS